MKKYVLSAPGTIQLSQVDCSNPLAASAARRWLLGYYGRGRTGPTQHQGTASVTRALVVVLMPPLNVAPGQATRLILR